ncbi:hypothetical protein K435DRAFT_801303 [Dendrothele bispora CBS 962.96]|uniref:Uncharacterized protein n=1 Tax=Dendrothele bispora (strain CBS 962.96) TaxID=1314807 RepID=A0A4S8LPS2_DENBC|nr:hypothetical protein K435DRAFT_801303 [Dendrothele bispora CBS 962.96]
MRKLRGVFYYLVLTLCNQLIGRPMPSQVDPSVFSYKNYWKIVVEVTQRWKPVQLVTCLLQIQTKTIFIVDLKLGFQTLQLTPPFQKTGKYILQNVRLRLTLLSNVLKVKTSITYCATTHWKTAQLPNGLATGQRKAYNRTGAGYKYPGNVRTWSHNIAKIPLSSKSHDKRLGNSLLGLGERP